MTDDRSAPTAHIQAVVDDIVREALQDAVLVERIREESLEMAFDLALYGYAMRRSGDSFFEAFVENGTDLVLRVDGREVQRKQLRG